jgi:alpha-tubulin suppressor-like RCC1 family protein
MLAFYKIRALRLVRMNGGVVFIRLQKYFIFFCISLLLIACTAGDPGGELGTAPSTPQLTGQAGDGSVNLDWPDNSQVAFYNIYWSSSTNLSNSRSNMSLSPMMTPGQQCESLDGETICMQSVSNSSYQLNGLSNNVTYYFTVIAYNDAGESPPSTQISLTPQPTPPAPTNINTTLGFTDLLISWDAVIGPMHYKVYLADAPEDVGNVSPIDTADTALHMIDIEFGKTYYIAVSTLDTVTNIESPLSPVSEVTTFKRPQYALGQRHTCAINNAKHISCAGSNEFGQLGNSESGVDTGATAFSNIVDSGQHQWEMIVAGENYNCAIDSDQQLYCWGDNRDHNLATGSIDNIVPTPTRISSNLGWLWIAAYKTHLCGIKTDHSLWCWGNNDRGQLGADINTVIFQELPLQLGSRNDWLSVSVGESHTCAIRQDHSLWCWGADDYGQIGNPNSATPSATPYQVQPNERWIMVVSGQFFNCAIKTDHSGWCWGGNANGQLGNLTVVSQSEPTPITGSQQWQWLTAGSLHVCAIDAEQDLWCWGDNWSGQLGNGNFDDSIQPVRVDTSREYAMVAAGEFHTCALKHNQSFWCWGYNLFGQLGRDSTQNHTNEYFVLPQQSGSMASDWLSIDVGYDHVCGIRSSGTLWCWGANYSGQLARQTFVDAAQPRLIENHFNWAQVSSGTNNGCSIKTDGSLFCWGWNSYGQVGNGIFFDGAATAPRTVESTLAWQSITNGDTHTCGIKEDNTAWCWGDNSYGQIGIDTMGLAIPTLVNTTLTWKSLKAGSWHTCGIAMDDMIYCWGWNAYGQLGTGDTASQPLPTPLADNSTWKKLDTQLSHTCAIKSDDTLWCWGYNGSGQLGNGEIGETNNQTIPVAVASTQLFKDVDVGAWNTCATTINDEVFCWGGNFYGVLANGNRIDQPLPQPVLGNLNPVDVQSGANVSCLLNYDSTVWCWGDNSYGQVGNGTAWVLFPEIVQLPE